MPTLKLNTSRAATQDGAGAPPTPAGGNVSAAATPGSGGGFKLKHSASQPPTPAFEQAPGASATPTQAPAKKGSKAAGDKGKSAAKGGTAAAGSKKRAANDDISPAPKRPAKNAHERKFSLKIGPKAATFAAASGADEAPQSNSGQRISLGRRKSTQPKLRGINVKRPPPPRLPGQGYDSEDSDAEDDPAIQQAFVLRMEPGEDCDYVREAIKNGKIGLPSNEGGADVSLKFIEKDFRRAVLSVRNKKYAAVLVDLPCIVESMKSWDKKGWWKVADISQMLLVLGRCSTDEEAKNYALPARVVDKETLQYAHGLTPPMHWVRKRRFRKRLSYKTIANVEEEVERLLKEDEQVENVGGSVDIRLVERAELERDQSQDEEGDAVETVENGEEYEEYDDEDEEGDADLEGNLQAMFDEDHANASASEAGPVTELVTESPRPLADQVASYNAIENAMHASDSPATEQTPIDAPETTTQDEQSSDEDEDDASSDEDSPDVLDEDAAAKAAERNQQLEEVADLEREVAAQQMKADNMKNMLLKERALAQLKTLREDLRVKRMAVFGDEEDEEGDVED